MCTRSASGTYINNTLSVTLLLNVLLEPTLRIERLGDLQGTIILFVNNYFFLRQSIQIDEIRFTKLTKATLEVLLHNNFREARCVPIKEIE